MHNKMVDHPDMVYFKDFMEQGQNILTYLSTEAIIKKYDIIGVEYVLYEPLYGNFYFKGFIDLVVRDKKTGKYVIIDWKTSGEAWDVNKKKKDEIFLAQMRLYKYFFARKNNIPLEDITCRYVVLNRLKSKRLPELGMGEMQPVEIYSSNDDILDSLTKVASTIKNIHIDNVFLKAKLNNKLRSCVFCPFKNNLQYCNSKPDQYKTLLEEHMISKRVL